MDTALIELTSLGILEPGSKLSHYVIGSKALRAVPFITATPGQPRLRTLFHHRYSALNNTVTSTKYDESTRLEDYGDINLFTYSPMTSFETRILSTEVAFDSTNRRVIGGCEIFSISRSDSIAGCSICFREVPNDSKFSPFNGGGAHDLRSHAAYVYMTSCARTLCDKCYDAGVLNEGPPLDTISYLHREKLVENSSPAVLEYSSHALSRLGRIRGANTQPKELNKIIWTRLKGRTVTARDLSESGYKGMDNADGGRFVMVGSYPPSWDTTGPRKLNILPVISIVAIEESKFDDNLTPYISYKVITILPSVNSKDVRSDRIHRVATMEDLTSVVTSEKVLEKLDMYTFMIKPTYNLNSDGSDYATHVKAVTAHLQETKRFSILSTYETNSCYACHRSWRYDLQDYCSGAVCPYSGRIPIYSQRVMSSALFSYLNRPEAASGFKRVSVRNDRNCDTYTLRPITRCEMSGVLFVCTEASGKLSRPILRATIKKEVSATYLLTSSDVPMCICCYIKCKTAGILIGTPTKINPSEYEPVDIHVEITNPDIYRKGLDLIFSGIEAPTCYNTENVLGVPNLDTKIKKLWYLSSAKGLECQLVTPFAISSSYFQENGCIEPDAWENCVGMAVNIPLMEYPVISKISVMGEKINGLTYNVLGPNSISEAIGGTITNNTRFINSRSGLSPTVYRSVDLAISGWIEKMPDETIDSMCKVLMAYRKAVRSCIRIARPDVLNTLKSNSTTKSAMDEAFDEVVQRIYAYTQRMDILSVTDLAYIKTGLGTEFMSIMSEALTKLKPVAVGPYDIPPNISASKELIKNAISTLDGELSQWFNIWLRRKEADLEPLPVVVSNVLRNVQHSLGRIFEGKVLRVCKPGDLPERSFQTHDQVWRMNLVYTKPTDNIVLKKVVINTPPFVWSVAVAIKKHNESPAKVSDQVQSMYGTCTLSFDNGVLQYNFPCDPAMKLVWGNQLRPSSLFGSRLFSILPYDGSKLAVHCMRETETNALRIYKAVTYGHR